MIRLNTEKIEALRKKRKTTQAELAQRVGITLRAYSKIVNGGVSDVRLKTVGQFCDALAIKPQAILTYEPEA